jgi:hypothetical protein
VTLQSKTIKKRKASQAVSGMNARIVTPIDAGTMPMDRIAAATLIENWLHDTSGYDEEVWPVLQAEIETNRLARRARFHD